LNPKAIWHIARLNIYWCLFVEGFYPVAARRAVLLQVTVHFERVPIYWDEEKSLLFAGLTRFLSPAAAGDSK